MSAKHKADWMDVGFVVLVSVACGVFSELATVARDGFSVSRAVGIGLVTCPFAWVGFALVEFIGGPKQ